MLRNEFRYYSSEITTTSYRGKEFMYSCDIPYCWGFWNLHFRFICLYLLCVRACWNKLTWFFMFGRLSVSICRAMPLWRGQFSHYNDVIMTKIASQITSLTVVYSTVYWEADQRKHQSSASLAFVWGIHRDRWIPSTKGQLRGKCFHLMTSSCTESSQNTSHSSPVRARYGVYFVCSNCGLYFVPITAVMYAVSCYIGLRYNGTWLYMANMVCCMRGDEECITLWYYCSGRYIICVFGYVGVVSNKIASLTLFCTTPHNKDLANYSVIVLFLANGDEYRDLTHHDPTMLIWTGSALVQVSGLSPDRYQAIIWTNVLLPMHFNTIT